MAGTTGARQEGGLPSKPILTQKGPGRSEDKPAHQAALSKTSHGITWGQEAGGPPPIGCLPGEKWRSRSSGQLPAVTAQTAPAAFMSVVSPQSPQTWENTDSPTIPRCSGAQPPPKWPLDGPETPSDWTQATLCHRQQLKHQSRLRPPSLIQLGTNPERSRLNPVTAEGNPSLFI